MVGGRHRTRTELEGGGGGGGSGGFCMGMGAMCMYFALLMPTIVDVLKVRNYVIVITELYLLCPLMSVLAAGCQPCS